MAINALVSLALAAFGSPDFASGPAADTIPLSIRYEDGHCSARMEDREYRIPEDTDGIEAHFADLRERNIGVRLDMEHYEFVPWRCVGGLIFLAQRHRMRIVFVAEPSEDASVPDAA